VRSVVCILRNEIRDTWCNASQPRSNAGRVPRSLRNGARIIEKAGRRTTDGRELISASLFYTFRKSPLSPKARDVAYRHRKSLRILTESTSVWVSRAPHDTGDEEN